MLLPERPAARDRRLLGARSERRDRAIAVALLVLIVLCTVAVVLGAADRPSFLSAPSHTGYFPHWLAGPLGGLWTGFTRSPQLIKWFFTAAMVLMYIAYILGLRYLPQLRARWVIVTILVVHLILFLSPPLALTDVFNYINYGRMGVVDHLNPYATIPALEPHSDPSFDLSNWHNLLTPYGPAFTLITYAIVPLGIAGSLWSMKLLMMLASLTTVLLVWKCARLLGRDPIAAIVLVGLNPIVLLWGLGGVHNDFLTVLCAVLAFYLLLRGGVGEVVADIARPPEEQAAGGDRLGDEVAGGDGSASGVAGGDGLASGVAGGDGLASGVAGGDGLASGVAGGDGLASGVAGGDGLASGVAGGDGLASGVAGATGSAQGASDGDGSANEVAGSDGPVQGAAGKVPGTVSSEVTRETPGGAVVGGSLALEAAGTEGPEEVSSALPFARAHVRVREWLPEGHIFAGLSPLDLGAGAALAAAISLKASAGILVPVVLAALLRSPRRLCAVLVGLAVAGAVLVVASVLAFGFHLPDLGTQGRLVISVSLPNLLGLALGQGGETETMRVLLSAALVGSVLLSGLLAWRWRDSLTAAGWATFALLVTLSWVLPWYILWVLPLAALSRSRRLRTAVLALGAYLILAWMPMSTAMDNAIGFHPSKTPLGELHQRYVSQLLN